MNWITFVMITLMISNREYLAIPTPLKLPGQTQKLTPFIKHWEAANFDRILLESAHERHIEQKHQRKKRDLGHAEYALTNTIKINFFAHDKEFRLVLRQDPLSVFTSDAAFESTLGPIDYDISRIYTGSLEGEENSRIHAILTSDNLLDGTIETATGHYYIEPTQKYSSDLYNSGVHSIIYKLDDVDMKSLKAPRAPTSTASPSNHRDDSSSEEAEYCASERLRRNMLFDEMKQRMSTKQQTKSNTESKESLQRNEKNEDILKTRKKRWLPEEFSKSGSEHQDPPLPLDLDVPYNDDISIFSDTKPNDQPSGTFVTTTTTTTSSTESPIINNSKKPVDLRDRVAQSGFAPNAKPKVYTKHKNIIVSTYGNNNNVNRTNPFEIYREREKTPVDSISARDNTRIRQNDRPNHKTHVEIITKNGATKKPNIIVNNYNPPDIMMTPSNTHYPNFNTMFMTNLLSGRGIDGAGYNDITSSQDSKSTYNRKITCMLYLQADHTFFQKMGSDEASIEAITRHVQRANSIYKNTDFNNDGKPDNITFMIKRIKVHNNDAIKDPSYRFPGNYGVEKFLELFSEEDYDAFCLAYMFTYRDFEMGTLGLAWTGDLKNAGGVCEKNGHYRGSLKSLNTGIVTLLNYGKHVPPAVSHVTLAHEIGHNFGSPHDPEQCTPGGEDGNFIMFARATSGDKRNNNKFSPCSLKSIEPVLNTKARSNKGCFTEPQTSICGNGVVEPGEECDCGWEEDCKDSCCFPMSRYPRSSERPCTLTPGSLCSPSQGPCCTNDCRLKFGDKCRDDNGCRDPSFCDGHMPQCPPSINKPNKTICNREFVCFMGECTGSICLAYGLESCQCIPGPNDDKIKACELCCKLPGEDKPCRSSFEWNEPPYDVPDMFAKPGTPCNDYNGYCDVFQKCREVDPSGPLATLRKLLLSEESIATFKIWMERNWYLVLLAVIVVVILFGLATHLLSKRSKLKKKTVTIIHSATTETVRLPEDNNGVIVHRTVRTKVPFKKKVRGKRSATNKKLQKNKGKSGHENEQEPKDNAKSRRKIKVNPLNNNNVSNGTENQQQEGRLNTGSGAAAAAALQSPEQKASHNNISAVNLKKDNQKKSSHNKFKRHSTDVGNFMLTNYNNNTKVGGVGGGGAAYSGDKHNAFSKVQKWLLDSQFMGPTITQVEPASTSAAAAGSGSNNKNNIAGNGNSSKVRKSQSTPERLLHKSVQRTKSAGNVNAAPNEKVRLQVVYKPPFRFALQFSKRGKIKTRVVKTSGNNAAGGAQADVAGDVAKRPRRQHINAKPKVNEVTVRGTDEVDAVKPTAAAVESGKHQTADIASSSNNNSNSSKSGVNNPKKVLNGQKPRRSTSEDSSEKTTEPAIEPVKPMRSVFLSKQSSRSESASNEANGNSIDNQTAMLLLPEKSEHNKQRSKDVLSGKGIDNSNSDSKAQNLDAIATKNHFLVDLDNKVDYENYSPKHYGSTQNLLSNGSTTNLRQEPGNLGVKSKKRSSLNLKSSHPKNSSNKLNNLAFASSKQHQRRASYNAPSQQQHQPQPATALNIAANDILSSVDANSQSSKYSSAMPTPLTTTASSSSVHLPRNSFHKNIPRPSLSKSSSKPFHGISHSTNPFSSIETQQQTVSPHLLDYSNLHQRDRSNSTQEARLLPPPPPPSNHHQRSNSVRQQTHNYHPPPPLPTTAATSSIAPTAAASAKTAYSNTGNDAFMPNLNASSRTSIASDAMLLPDSKRSSC